MPDLFSVIYNANYRAGKRREWIYPISDNNSEIKYYHLLIDDGKNIVFQG